MVVSSSPLPANGDESATQERSEQKPVDWRQDLVCQMVFFAVLEGLYTDGVSEEVVSSLVPKTASGSSLKANFVAECPLCHPVYEALIQYRDRTEFAGSKSKGSSFGSGLSKEESAALRSDSRMVRLKALRPLVKRWVDRRMKLMRLSKEEHTKLTADLFQRSQQGKQKLMDLIRRDPAYENGWSVYWGCAACNGATGACMQQQPSQLQKK